MDASHPTLGRFRLVAGSGPGGAVPALYFTENETNQRRLFGAPNPAPWVKDAFHELLVGGNKDAVNPAGAGTKAAFHYVLDLAPHGGAEVRLRLSAAAERSDDPLGPEFEGVVADRLAEADAFFAARIPGGLGPDARDVVRQAYAGLAWNKQFYHYVVQEWLDGDPAQPPPPPQRLTGRNHDWTHVFNRDVISMPDSWEYPWYAAWDLAFHTLPISRVDPAFAKGQLVLLLREWYMHPNGQIPAYEFAFSDVNPPVHAWAAWRVYKITGPRGGRDRLFLERVFQKLLLNFTWWVNRKDPAGNHLFSGGFLGLDNIGVFDRSRPLPTGGFLEQADGTAWMASYCATMLAIALELASADPAYEDVASKFFEHFVAIADAMNSFGGTGLWDDEEGFYYDQLMLDGRRIPLRIRSLVGLIPLLAVEVLEDEAIDRLPGFRRRLDWFLSNRGDLARHISYMATSEDPAHRHRLLAIPSRERLSRVLRYMLDENEFLSPHGIRSLSRHHLEHPFVFPVDGHDYSVGYEPGESTTRLFGGNSNWRGPVWLPLNYLLVEALERYHHFYGDAFTVECPAGSGTVMTLAGVAREITRRVASLFLRGADGRRPCHGPDRRFADDALWRDQVLFHEYFDGDTGRGLGASHQTGWTALAARFIESLETGEPPA